MTVSGIEAVVRDPELSVSLTTAFPRYNASKLHGADRTLLGSINKIKALTSRVSDVSKDATRNLFQVEHGYRGHNGRTKDRTSASPQLLAQRANSCQVRGLKTRRGRVYRRVACRAGIRIRAPSAIWSKRGARITPQENNLLIVQNR